MDIFSIDIGQQAKVPGYNLADKGYRHKLLTMGLTRGAVFKLLRVAPLGCPIEIEVRGSALCLRKKECDILQLERVNP